MKPKLVMVAALVATSLALAGVAVAHRGAAAQVEGSKHKHGPWHPNGTTGNQRAGTTRSYYLRVTNTSTAPAHTEHVTLQAFDSSPGYHVKWFKGHRDITEAAHDTGAHFRVLVGHPQRLRVQVHVVDDSEQACIEGQFDVHSDSDTEFGVIRVNGNSPCGL
jgi:hypothetical protein